MIFKVSMLMYISTDYGDDLLLSDIVHFTRQCLNPNDAFCRQTFSMARNNGPVIVGLYTCPTNLKLIRPRYWLSRANKKQG